MDLNRIKCLIVEDEPLAQKLLTEHIAMIDTLELVGTAFDATQARVLIESKKPDLIFLDISLPKMNGYDFLMSLPLPRPLVVVTTAYPEFALKGYELEIIDFLQKPIFFNPEFKRAINRVETRLRLEQLAMAGEELSDKVFLVEEDRKLVLLRSNYELYRVPFDDILYIESWDNYVKVFRRSQPMWPLTPRTTLMSISKVVPLPFLRIHRQYIVNMQHVQKLNNANLEIVNGKELPISKSHIEQVRSNLS